MPDDNIRKEKAPPTDNVFIRTGSYRDRIDPVDVRLWPDLFQANEYGVLVSWQRMIGDWLTVNASGADGKLYGKCAEDLRKILSYHRSIDSDFGKTILGEGWSREYGFAVGTATASAPTRLDCQINTNHPGFVRFAEDSANLNPDGEGLLIPLMIRFFRGADGDSARGPAALQLDRMALLLVIRPGTHPRQDDCLAAIDLGNTNTSVALMSPEHRATGEIQLLSTGTGANASLVPTLGPDGAPIPSDVRLDLVRTWLGAGQPAPATRKFPDFEQHSNDDKGYAANWVVGEIVRREKGLARSLILGAKRMASARKDGWIPVFAEHRVVFNKSDGLEPTQSSMMVDVDTRLPVELLACSLFRNYREVRKRWPGRLAMTYPTTFSRGEIQRIRRAIQCGWLRMQERRRFEEDEATNADDRELDALCRSVRRLVNGPIDIATQSEDPLIRLVLDEASAAAFFYLYRKIFEERQEKAGRKHYETKSGGLVAFRGVYPNGLNMLLYDCGGGTTDIAIVSARVLDDWRTLQITVRARSGLRDFGGDDITTQVARLLKAKMANLLVPAQQRVELPNVPSKPPGKDDDWEKLAGALSLFIDRVGQNDPNDLRVPTKDLGSEPLEERRAAALALWNLAEAVKVKLGELKPNEFEVKPDPIKPGDSLGRFMLKGSAQEQAELQKKLQPVTISRIEVDALIFAKIKRSLKNCNALIDRVLGRGTQCTGEAPSEIQWVVASGSAVRYPFVEQMLRSRLDVAFLSAEDADDDDGRFLFDCDNAKSATAKGAVLSLSVMENPGSMMKVHFDSDLADRLPFDIGFFSFALGQDVPLYSEHTHYRELQQREPILIPLGDGPIEHPFGRQFVLRRRFLGDSDYADFIKYEFDEVIHGPHLSIRYDDSSPYEFTVKDGLDLEGVPRDATASEIHRSPAQRGDI